MTYSKATLKRLAKLKHKKYRDSEHLFLAEGKSLVEEARISPTRIFTDPEAIGILSTLTTPVGPIAVFPFLDVTPEELLRRRNRIVLLHGVQNPGNTGTVIRAAHAFGSGVALAKGTADLYNPKTVRATMGSIFHAPVAREIRTLSFLEEAKASGFTTVAAVPQGGDRPSDMPTEKLMIVVGAEGSGLSEEVVAACHRPVTIPALAASLNAAVAATILLYEAYTRVLP